MSKLRIAKETWKTIILAAKALEVLAKEIWARIQGSKNTETKKLEDYDKLLEEQADAINKLTEQSDRLVEVIRILERKVNILIWVSISAFILAIAATLIAVFK